MNTNISIDQPQLDVLPPKGMFLDGKYVVDPSGSEYAHVYAATGAVTTSVPLAGREGVDAAVQSARKALPRWRNMPAAERRAVLMKFAQLLIENDERLARMSTIENGMLTKVAKVFMGEAASWLSYYAGNADKLLGEVDEVTTQNISYHVREPYGVVALLVPFNAPILIMCVQASAALAVGNCVVVKPSYATPFTASSVAELFIEAGGPPGVFNVVPCKGHVGETLASHPGVDKIHLTGSTASGRAVMAAASKNVTPVGLELGGKSALVAFDDADLGVVSQACVGAVAALSGQHCAKQSRILVQSGVYDELIEMTKSMVEKIAPGDPTKESTGLGPVVSELQCKEIMGFIERAKQSKACRLVTGGERLGGSLASGHFIAPTIFADVDASMEIFRKEVFGPVLTFTKFETEEEAVRLANASEYGLAGSVFTQDFKRAHRVALGLETGTILLNGLARTGHYSRPMGGFKQSGLGRVGGSEGIKQFTHTKTMVAVL